MKEILKTRKEKFSLELCRITKAKGQASTCSKSSKMRPCLTPLPLRGQHHGDLKDVVRSSTPLWTSEELLHRNFQFSLGKLQTFLMLCRQWPVTHICNPSRDQVDQALMPALEKIVFETLSAN
jgi:hypothetical protein